MKKINQSGRSMIEMLGVLAIIGVLSVGGIAGYSKAMQKYRINKTIDQISQISNGIHTLYGNRTNYAGLDINVLAKAKVIPQELVESVRTESAKTSSPIVADWVQNHPDNFMYPEEEDFPTEEAYQALVYSHEWEEFLHAYERGEQVVSFTQTLQGTNPFDGHILLTVEDNAKAFSLNYLGLPEDACIEVLTQDWGSSDLIAVGVDSQITSTYGCTGDKGSHVCNNQLPVSVDKAMDLCSKQNDSKGVILKFR